MFFTYPAIPFIFTINFITQLFLVILLIVLGVLGITNLATAVVLHEGSTIVVVLNALRLLRVPDETVPVEGEEAS